MISARRKDEKIGVPYDSQVFWSTSGGEKTCMKGKAAPYVDVRERENSQQAERGALTCVLPRLQSRHFSKGLFDQNDWIDHHARKGHEAIHTQSLIEVNLWMPAASQAIILKSPSTGLQNTQQCWIHPSDQVHYRIV